MLMQAGIPSSKGHFELLDAFLLLNDDLQKRFQLTFAGKTISQNDETLLLEKMKGKKNIHYIGPQYGEEKRKVFSEAHIFCLPTYYPYEGQPFSIIEAYATGCVVITTDHSGIKYIFQDNVNGFQVEMKSVIALRDLFERILEEKLILTRIAISNLRQSKDLYTTQKYTSKMKNVFEKVYANGQKTSNS